MALYALVDVAPEQEKWLSQHWHSVVIVPLCRLDLR